jgi:hypothetical protein
MTLRIERVAQDSHKLGRQLVHDTRSRAFAIPTAIDRTTWRDRLVRLYEPVPNPNQRVGCCTGVAKCSQFNTLGNRKIGRVLRMSDAERIYSRNTEIDPWEGSWEPDDTGSSGLASCKTAQEFGLGGEYWWEFRGADGVVQNVMEGRVLSVGTWWTADMFVPDAQGRVRPTGGLAGGHQYVIRGYDVDRDWLMGRCWWGSFRDFWIARTDLDDLLRDGGDAHWQRAI